MTIYRVQPDDMKDIALQVVDWIDRRIEHGLPSDCQLAIARQQNEQQRQPVQVWSAQQLDVIHRQLGRVERALLNAGPREVPEWCLNELARIVAELERQE